MCIRSYPVVTSRFLRITGCSVFFIWHTEAACPLNQDEDITWPPCEVASANNPDHIYNLQPLMKKNGLGYHVDKSDGSHYEVNYVFCICLFSLSNLPTSLNSDGLSVKGFT